MANILDFGGVRALTSNAQPGAGYVAKFYQSGTTTPVTVYTDSTLATDHGTSVTADSAGRFAAVWSSGGAIKCVIEDGNGAVIQTIDPVLSVSGGGATAADIPFAPTVELPVTNVQDAIEASVAAAASGFAAFGLGVTGNAALLANIDATGTASGVYRWDGTSTGTFPAGITAATTGLIDFSRQTAAEGMMTLRAAGQSRNYRRFLAATTWGAWQEVPGMTDPNTNRVLGWDDTANAYAWFPPGQYTWMTPQATTSGTQFDFTGIPAGVTELIIAFSRVSLSGTDSVRVQLGDASSFETTGYDGSAVSSQSTIINTASAGVAGFNVGLANSANAAIGFMTIHRPFGDNEWVSSVNIGLGAQHTWSAQTKTLTGTLTRVRITRAASDTFDFGRVNVGYR